MRIKNKEIEGIYSTLYDLKLKGKVSRMRTRFIRILQELIQEFDNDRIQLIKEYGEVNEDGSFVFTDDTETEVVIKKEDIIEFNEQFEILLVEESVIEENESNKRMLLSVAETVLDGDFEVSGEEALLYDVWCEKFEEVIENYKQSEEENSYEDNN